MVRYFISDDNTYSITKWISDLEEIVVVLTWSDFELFVKKISTGTTQLFIISETSIWSRSVKKKTPNARVKISFNVYKHSFKKYLYNVKKLNCFNSICLP